MSSARVWLVTGSASGFGREMVELALKNGEKVVATLRRPSELDDLRDKYSPSQLLIAQLDVTKAERVAEVFRAAKQAFGKVDVVLNNAGLSIVSEVEGTPEDVARAMFEVNFWAAANVSREAVRFFREENAPGVGGRLLNLGSILGVQPSPIMSYYSASKHALDGLTTALAAEINPKWNIKVTLVCPVFFRTSIRDKGTRIPVHPAYIEATSGYRKSVDAAFHPSRSTKIGDPKKGAQKIFELSKLTDEVPLRLFLGKSARGRVDAKIAALTEDADAYASWSDDLLEA
ncbi:uncharacterized protein PHACADRAFT_187373 [Phanerochaete carnosa HHB-10118-sp]|uniref:Uncharacterized protein n=1 Tax=Phanerochaete carnosa (strain HHB-10118-sp) TaxID=650164 RepID=K5VZF7_PHACS|nr:uncharacterized protein PHACADRAFT_187373 [Phanerochaete carnosa HHB-10118-sp]EKM51999.1 hypothetical protein PHACADRAFT_187373 [Phanerochaete carnosa HHB-10118-sp]